MSQATAFGEASISTYMEVKKANGDIRYYRIQNGVTTEISEETYKGSQEK